MQSGDQCRLYKNTGTNASPVWVEIDKCKDLSAPVTFGEGDSSARDCEFELTESGLIKIEVTFGYQYVPGTDAIYDALVTELVARTERIYAIADGDITTSGTRYIKLPAQLRGMDNEEPLDGAKVSGFRLKPTRLIESSALIKPAFVTV